jgi:hypothetical protein
MSSSLRIRTTRAITVLLAVYPLIVLGAFLIFVLRARLHLGYWPQYGRPDPKALDWAGHRDIIIVAVAFAPIAIAIAAFLAAMPLFRSPWIRQRTPVVWFCVVLGLILASSLCLIAYERYDPGGFINWFLD